MNTPKFKEGDWIKSIHSGRTARVVMLLKTCYSLRFSDDDSYCLDYGHQDNWELTDAPSNKSLEEAAGEYVDTICPVEYPKLFNDEQLRNAFIAGAEWQKGQMVPNEDVFKIWGTTEKEYLAKSMDKVHLEMEISTYLKDWEDDEEIGLHLSTDNGCIPIELEDVRDLARHFYELGKEDMKEQMLKETVEGFIFQSADYYPKELIARYDGELGMGDKVRIVVLKEKE